MTVQTVTKSYHSLTSFLAKYGNTRSKLQALLFWSRHPEARFTLECIVSSRDAKRLDLKEGVMDLVGDGIVIEERASNGVAFYRLTSDPEKRASVFEIAKIGPYFVQYLFAENQRAPAALSAVA